LQVCQVAAAAEIGFTWLSVLLGYFPSAFFILQNGGLLPFGPSAIPQAG
jgi:hypothetical protein